VVGYLPEVIAPDIDVIGDQIRKARYTFLFDSDGRFIANSIVVIAVAEISGSS